MISGKDIIVLNLTRWDAEIISSGIKIAQHLSLQNNVLLVDNPLSLFDILFNNRTKLIKRRLGSFISFKKSIHKLEFENGNLFCLYLPPILPMNGLREGKLYNFVNKINHYIIFRRINKAIRKLRLKNIIFINDFNFYFPSIGKMIKPDLSIYYCVDELVKPYSLRHGRRLENIITKDADIVICTSKALRENRIKLNQNCFTVTNGCEFEHFNNNEMNNVSLETKAFFNQLKHPIIGFYGNAERRTDTELLHEVFKNHKELTLLMVGPKDKQFDSKNLELLENVCFMGSIGYSELPFILQQFDVAIIPYKIDSVSRTIFPLKLFEYFAGGKPVVAINFNPDILNELSEKHLVYIGNDPTSFASSIYKALNENNLQLIDQRIALAQKNDWSVVTEKISKIIENELIKMKKLSC